MPRLGAFTWAKDSAYKPLRTERGLNRIGFSQRLELRQSQALVMTPQLQQAIKMLQLSNLELADYVDAEIEQNPLLERTEGDEDGAPIVEANGAGANNVAVAAGPAVATETAAADFTAEGVEQWDASRGGDGDGSAGFDGDTAPWRSRNGAADSDDFPGLDQAAARPRTLREHILEQIGADLFQDMLAQGPRPRRGLVESGEIVAVSRAVSAAPRSGVAVETGRTVAVAAARGVPLLDTLGGEVGGSGFRGHRRSGRHGNIVRSGPVGFDDRSAVLVALGAL